MRSVVVVDRWFAGREMAMLSRLEIGLVDEGYRVVRALPVASLGADQGGVYSTVAGYVDTGLWFTLNRRVAGLVETLDALAEKQGDKGGVGVVHGLGGRAWPVAAELARQTGAALVLELDRAALLSEAARLAAPAQQGERDRPPTPMFLVPSEPLRQALIRQSPSARTHLSRWGVHVASGRRGRGETRAVAIFAERGDSRGVQAVLEALAAISRDEPGLMMFAHVQDDNNAPLWKTARRLGLLERLSLSPDMEAHRDPVMQVDALLMPDASGTVHSLALDAEAAGLVVLSAPDEMVEYLRDGQTARTVIRPDARDWEEAIRQQVLDAAQWGVLGATAREYVRAHHPVSGHIHAVLAAYQESIRLHAEDEARRSADRRTGAPGTRGSSSSATLR